MFRIGEDIPYGYCQCGCGARTEIAHRTQASRNWVKGEPKPCLLYHHVRGKQIEVEDCGFETPCWVWIRARYPEGYGSANLHGLRKGIPAHRLVFEQYRGPIPDGLELDHLCRNKPCVNPDHLEPVTHTENGRRGPHIRASMEVARKIRESDLTLAALATEVGLSISAVWAIRNNETWKEAAQ